MNTHASSEGSIVGRLERKRSQLSNGDEETFVDMAHKLGYSDIIEDKVEEG